MTAKAGEGEAAERKQRLRLLLPLFGIACFAVQLSGSRSASQMPLQSTMQVLPGVREISTSVPPCYQTYSSTKTLVSSNKECEAHHPLFCLTYFVSSQKAGDYSMRRVRAEVEAATCLWMAAKFCLFRAEKSNADRSLSGRQFTVQFHHCSYPEINPANGFSHWSFDKREVIE